MQTLRLMIRRPAGFLAALLALVTGLVIVTFAAALLSSFFLSGLPVEDESSLYRVREATLTDNGELERISSLNPTSWKLLRERNSVFVDIAAGTSHTATVTGGSVPVMMNGARVSPNFFAVLGIRPSQGRDFTTEDGGNRNVVLLSHSAWVNQFGEDPDIIGQAIRLNGEPRTVAGVMPKGIHHPYQAAFWIPSDFEDMAFQRAPSFLYAPARLKPGITPTQAEAALEPQLQAMTAEYPDAMSAEAARLYPLRDEALEGIDSVARLVILTSVFVLLLSVVNVVSIICTNSIRETRNNGIRLAFGASRGQIFRHTLLRHVLLTLVAAGIALAISVPLIPGFFNFAGLSLAADFGTVPAVDGSVISITLAAAAVVALVLALIETTRIYRTDAGKALTTSSRSATDNRAARRLLLGLLTLQIAISFAITSTSLVVREDISRLLYGDPGYTIDNRIMADISFTSDEYPTAADKARRILEVERTIASMPQVRAVGASQITPDYPGAAGVRFGVPDTEMPEEGFYVAHERYITPDYFKAMNMDLSHGRSITVAEAVDPQSSSIIVSKAFAERFFTDGDALGKRINQVRGDGSTEREWRIVGIAADIEDDADSYFPDEFVFYKPVATGRPDHFRRITFAIHSDDISGVFARQLRNELARAIPDLGADWVAPLRDRLRDVNPNLMLSSSVFGLFGIAASVVATMGLFLTMIFVGMTRSREFAIREALGAAPAGLLGLIFRGSLGILAFGLLAGIPLLFLSTLGYRFFTDAQAEIDTAHVAIPLLTFLLIATAATMATFAVSRKPIRSQLLEE